MKSSEKADTSETTPPIWRARTNALQKRRDRRIRRGSGPLRLGWSPMLANLPKDSLSNRGASDKVLAFSARLTAIEKSVMLQWNVPPHDSF